MSLSTVGIPLGTISASVVLLVMSKTFATSGWRVAMLLSVLIAVPALVARHKFAESPLFEQLKETGKLAALPSFGVLKNYPRSVILLALFVAFQSVEGNVGSTYLVSFMRFAGIPLATIAAILIFAKTGTLLGILASGPAADLCKRRLTACIATGVAMLLPYPLTLAILGKHIALLILLEILISFFGIGIVLGLTPTLACESFPTKFRYSGSGVSFNLAQVLGAMIAPSLLAGLIGQDVFHKWYYIPIVYGFYGAVSMVALLFMRETRDLKLEDLDQVEHALSKVRA